MKSRDDGAAEEERGWRSSEVQAGQPPSPAAAEPKARGLEVSEPSGVIVSSGGQGACFLPERQAEMGVSLPRPELHQ